MGAVSWQDAEIDVIEKREDLARYLVGLAARVRRGEIPIENSSTDAFVDSARRWTKSMDSFFKNVLKESVPDTPDWAMVAAIFRAALVYE